MPNWCSTSYCIHGPKNAVEDARKFILKALADAPMKDASSPNSWLGQIVIACGEEYENVSCRGWIQDITEIEEQDIDNEVISYFYIYSEDAWGPNPEVFELMLKKKFSGCGLKLCFLAEEPGCCVYVNTDNSGRFLSDKWVLDDFNSFHEYFEADEDLIDFLNREFKAGCDSLDEVYEFVKKANEESKSLGLFRFSAE